MSKHTPGPWTAHTFLIRGRGRDEICHVGISNNLGPSRAYESEANARLMAASPELLEACAAVIKYFGRWRDSAQEPGAGSIDDIIWTIAEDPSTITECIDKARKAIAKAEDL